MVKTDTELSKKVKDLVLDGIDLTAGRMKPHSDPFWKALQAAGTEL